MSPEMISIAFLAVAGMVTIAVAHRAIIAKQRRYIDALRDWAAAGGWSFRE